MASGKWHGLSTPTPGALETPQPAGRVARICLEVYHCQLISTQPAFEVFSQVDSYDFPPKMQFAKTNHLRNYESEAQRGFSPGFFADDPR